MAVPDTSIQDTPAQIVERLGIFSSREWNLAVSSESWWRSKTGTVFTQMRCCAFCGVCSFPRFYLPVHDPAFPPPQQQCRSAILEQIAAPGNEQPPYAKECPALSDCCVSDGGRKWNVCVSCHNAHKKSARKPRSKFQSNLNETLTKDLLSLDHTFSQTLSAIDASVSFTHKVSGYFTGAPSKSSLFESPLLMYNVDRSLFYTDPPPDLTSFYNNHLHSCPALQTFRPVLQRTHPTLGIPYLYYRNLRAAKKK